MLEKIDEVVLEYEGFGFNDCGVCLNPENIIAFGNEKTIAYRINVANTPKGWSYGVQYSCNSAITNTGGGGWYPGLHVRAVFIDKKQAALDAAKYILQRFEEYFKYVPQLRIQDKNLNPLRIFIKENTCSIQLKLFDYA